MINHVESINTQKEKDAVLSSMTEGVLVIDNNKKILMINEPGISYLNIESDNPTGCFVDDTIKDEFSNIYKYSYHNQNTTKKEIRIKKNMKRFFLVNGTILQGEKMGALIVFSDITKLKQLEKIRQDFVANVSHELKTPITSIVGFLETVQQKNFPKEKRKSFLKKALKHSNRLNAIIDDLLWLSKIESMEDSESFDLTNQPLLGIINGAVDDIKSLKGMEDAKIEVSCDSSIELKADEQLLREAFINLLDNAIKYGDSKKKITITSNINKNLVIKFHNYGIPMKNIMKNLPWVLSNR